MELFPNELGLGKKWKHGSDLKVGSVRPVVYGNQDPFVAVKR